MSYLLPGATNTKNSLLVKDEEGTKTILFRESKAHLL